MVLKLTVCIESMGAVGMPMNRPSQSFTTHKQSAHSWIRTLCAVTVSTVIIDNG